MGVAQPAGIALFFTKPMGRPETRCSVRLPSLVWRGALASFGAEVRRARSQRTRLFDSKMSREASSHGRERWLDQAAHGAMGFEGFGKPTARRRWVD
jgi:hypothetical protein